MPKSEFWSKLIANDKIKCKNYINENLSTKNLVSIFNDLICFSVLTRKKSNSVYHPIIIINIIKNLIGDDKVQPSKILINFFIDFILNYKIRDLSLEKIPYIVVIGEKEIADQTVSLRSFPENKLVSMQLNEFLKKIKNCCRIE